MLIKSLFLEDIMCSKLKNNDKAMCTIRFRSVLLKKGVFHKYSGYRVCKFSINRHKILIGDINKINTLIKYDVFCKTF